MFGSEALIVVAIIALCMGVAIGVLIIKIWTPPAQQNLESQLQEAQHKLEEYQQNVDQHFLGTSKIIGNLAKNYKDLHDHMSQGAQQLAAPETSQALLTPYDDSTTDTPETLENLDDSDYQAPKDYAPKTPGQQHGVLSEKFGLSEEKESIETQTVHEATEKTKEAEKTAD